MPISKGLSFIAAGVAALAFLSWLTTRPPDRLSLACFAGQKTVEEAVNGKGVLVFPRCRDIPEATIRLISDREFISKGTFEIPNSKGGYDRHRYTVSVSFVNGTIATKIDSLD